MPTPSPFDLLDRSFCALDAGQLRLASPALALALDGTVHPVSPLELRAFLLRADTSYATRDAVLGELVRQARRGELGQTLLAGALLPGLRAILGPTVRAFPAKCADLEGEALLGLFEAVPNIRPERGRIAARLIWAARRQAQRLLESDLKQRRCGVVMARPEETLGRPSHPDVVLAEACQEHVLSEAEVAMIGDTRLEGVPAARYVRVIGADYQSFRTKRYRAELRLLAWLADR